MATKTVKDILEIYDIGDKSEEVVELIHKASSKSIKRHKAAPAIIVHVIHQYTDNTWGEICTELGVDSDRLLSHRKLLIKCDVLDDSIYRPSDMSQGETSKFLLEVENAHSDQIFAGTKPSYWVAAATFINDYIHLRDTPIEQVAEQFNVGVDRLEKFVTMLVSYDELDTAYATENVDADLGALLVRRRHTKESLRVSLSDTTKRVNERLRALEKESDYSVKYSDFYGKQFVWTEKS